MNKKILIVIPIYKNIFSNFENISIKQSLNIFKDRDICFILPKKLKSDHILKNKLNNLNKISKNIVFRYFEDIFFSSISGYNRLMLNRSFYENFIDYDYILICQTDVFIFEDKLNFFIEKEYDYIGAPWTDTPFEILNDNIKNKNKTFCGNGGLSLRKIKSHIKVLKEAKDKDKKRKILNIILDYPKKPFRYFIYYIYNTICLNFYMNEDVFFSYFANKIDNNFKNADFNTSVSFSIETTPQDMYKKNNNILPLGCHAWWKYDLNFWKPFIEKNGYKID